MPGLLPDRLPAIQHRALALDFVGQRPFDRTERVHVLDLGADAELRAGPAQGDIGVAAQAPLFHPAGADLDRLQDCAKARKEDAGLLWRPQVGFGDDLHQRHAAAIEIDETITNLSALLRVDEPAGIFFQVYPADPDAPAWDRQAAVGGQRRVNFIPVLGDLIVLRKIRVVIVLPVELTGGVHCAAQRGRRAQPQVDRLPVEDRQRPRQAQANRAD